MSKKNKGRRHSSMAYHEFRRIHTKESRDAEELRASLTKKDKLPRLRRLLLEGVSKL